MTSWHRHWTWDITENVDSCNCQMCSYYHVSWKSGEFIVCTSSYPQGLMGCDRHASSQCSLESGKFTCRIHYTTRADIVTCIVRYRGLHWPNTFMLTFHIRPRVPVSTTVQDAIGLRNESHVYFWLPLLSFELFGLQTSARVRGMHTNEACFHTQQPTHSRDTLTYGPLFWTVWAEHQSSIDQNFLSFALTECLWMAAGRSSLL